MYNLADILKEAKEIFFALKDKNESVTWSEAMKLAWAKTKIILSLKSGPFSFLFLNKEGKDRPANGTLNPSIISQYYQKKSTGKPRKTNPLVVAFFDLDKKQFRSFVITRLV